MPFAAMTQAASFANSTPLRRQSWAMTMPFRLASSPSAAMTFANAWVAWRMTWMFIWCRPSFIVPRRPAVPKSRGAKKRFSISFSSSLMALSSAHSASLREGLSSQC